MKRLISIVASILVVGGLVMFFSEQLNILNQGDNVYSVNEDYVKRHQKDEDPPQLVVAKSDDDLKPNEKNKIITPDGQQFQVIATKVDQSTGFDGMAVAPIRQDIA